MSNNQPAISKYLYIGNNKIAGPLTMSKPNDNVEFYASLDCRGEEEASLHLNKWNQHLAMLPRIDVIGEHSFTEGQILERDKDILLATRTPHEIEAAIPMPSLSEKPAISKEEVLRKHIPNGCINLKSYKEEVSKIGNAMQEYADLQTAALREENTRLKAENAELRDASKWIPIENEEALCNALKKYDILLLYDNGQIRRLGEAGHPFAINTHFLELPDIPDSILSKHKP